MFDYRIITSTIASKRICNKKGKLDDIVTFVNYCHNNDYSNKRLPKAYATNTFSKIKSKYIGS